MKAEQVPIARLIPDPHNPRHDFTEARLAEMAASLQTHGIKVPLIGYVTADGIMIGDGHCRFEAARSIDMQELPVIVFPHKPDEAELLATQLTINGHRHALNPVDEYEAFVRLAKLTHWNASQLATGLAVSNAEVTRVLAIGKLTPEERQLVRDGKISKSAAYALSRMSADQRAALARKAAAGEVTRDEINEQARKKKTGDALKKVRVSCPVPGGMVSVQTATGINLGGLIELFEGLIRECRKARSQGLDITTTVQVLRDRCQAQPTT